MQGLVLLMTLGAAAGQSDAKVAHASGFGIGVQTTLPGINATGSGAIGPEAGISIAYDKVDWRIATLLNVMFLEDNFTSFGLGGRFFYALHSGSMADFSVGGGVGFQFFDTPGAGNDSINAYFEGMGQLRVFVVSNVTFNATLGLGFRVGDGSTSFGMTGQAMGSFGLTYYFD